MPAAQPAVAIQPITAAQTYALRHAVLWPAKPLAYVQLPEDEAGQHFGAFVEGALVAVISLFVGAHGVARFRKFATDPAWQGRGVGTALLHHLIGVAQAQGASQLWCDARQNTLPFYQRFGLAPKGEVFYKGEVPYVRLSRTL
ncbi:GNAT family N-acetyltransferase [Hymenobacter cheonanensis]|uniref:GNAT family N-acetyltransferase n=1 Tax=Hymenobacter sp. CA2-7 TaxID=3063993 RepID=UPI002712D6D6|nr:GNAT family N-acetyltransferase [Hymenobacter sp. CA2-7]MDO7883890.1 GNAT family N-acetyltransferase [Hymenobacter sp. CA2-7]